MNGEEHDRHSSVYESALAILEPFAGMLMQRQLSISDAEEMLKSAFINASVGTLEAMSQKPTVSAVSVATGIHRRDVKRLMAAPRGRALQSKPSAVSRARLIWATDKNYLDSSGRPRRISKIDIENEYTFVSLSESVSKDIHPRALLDEMHRIGAVEIDGDFVTLLHVDYQPPKDQDELIKMASQNIGDHISTVVHNINRTDDPLLERSVFVDGLTPAAARHGAELARSVWAQSLGTLRNKLQTLADLDQDAPNNNWRVRIGMYAYCAEETTPKASDSELKTK